MTGSYYRGAHGIIVVYDVTDAESFESVKSWMHEVDKLANENVCKLIIGNKCDRTAERKVTVEQGQELAKHYDVQFLETSAKSALNVEALFNTMTANIYEKMRRLPQAKAQGIPKGKLKKGASIEEVAKHGCC